jgi:hydroxymethylpyrimidine pyrophosphatase-like HAD family hydrolase
MRGKVYSGVWMTDIDDTLIESGEMPDETWIKWLTDKIRVFKKYNIAWVPMSGVAIVKLGPRILYRLPEDVLSHVMYYGGDGSQKYFYDTEHGMWAEDKTFRTVFSDAQGLAVLGYNEYKTALEHIYDKTDGSEAVIEKKMTEAVEILNKNNISPDTGILSEMKQILKERAYDPDKSETYFRGGSVSWMMLGDISADPYRTDKAAVVRKELIAHAMKRLKELSWLSNIGERAIIIPFPGARGIKFVLKGNNKEKATRDIVDIEKINPENIIFAGNEIFEGGNDNMIRNVDGVTLLSVGEKTDPGNNIVYGGEGVAANLKWMDRVCEKLIEGRTWQDIINMIKESSNTG